MASIDPSKKLICQLVIGKVNPADPQLQPATWENLFPLANREGLAPLLYWRLQSTGWPAALPRTVRQSLAEVYYGSVAHNALLFSELDKILPLLQRENIPTLLVKGASLALDFYPEQGLRPMVDVDCLVPRDSYRHASKLLRGLGYLPGNRDQVPGMHEMSDYHTGLKGGPGNRVIFELHWGLVSTPLAWYAAPVRWFWEHNEPWGGDGVTRQLTPLAHLVYLSGHTMLQHGGSQLLLIWLYDIHLLVESGRIDWNELVESVAGFHWGGVVAKALRWAQAAFDTNLPAGVLERLDQVSEPAVDQLVAFKQRFRGSRLMYDWYSLIALRGMSRLRYALGMIFPQPAYIRWRYNPRPAWLWPVYYPYRWLRMLIEGIQAVHNGILRAVR